MTPTPAPSAFTVSTFATCAQLAGTKQDGPLYQYISTITSSHATDAANIDKLRTLQTQLMGVADHADPKMKQLIENLWSTNVSDFKAAGVELVSECH
ncbi:hypothetical protein J2W21_000589 [Sinomonas atrocyanea]|uniref:hypothetical protein n=1 Tax=Sinomonas atrocyanea TaxID=37927 RepID=UPI00277F94C7|nr:hypothetical protein [Sinomonas atrocyanea]MDP9883099.1 hypothetical protein [Sinomonas atrocyanea]